MKVWFKCLAVVGACAGCFLAGLYAERGLATLVRGPARRVVLTGDVLSNSSPAEVTTNTPTCKGGELGGFMKGTRAELRSHGPFRFLTVTVPVISYDDFPARDETPTEIAADARRGFGCEPR
jgi:hypothetical protein